MIFPTAGYCLSVRYHSPIWFLLVVMSPRTKTYSGKNWVATCNVQILHCGWIMPSLWYTLMHTSTDKMFNLLLMTSSEKCPQRRVHFNKSENSGYLIIGWTRLSQGSCEFTFCPQLPLPTGAFPLSSTSQLFYLYYFHNCYYYLNTYFFLVIHEGTSATTGATSPPQQGSKLPRFYNSDTFFTSWRL